MALAFIEFNCTEHAQDPCRTENQGNIWLTRTICKQACQFCNAARGAGHSQLTAGRSGNWVMTWIESLGGDLVRSLKRQGATAFGFARGTVSSVNAVQAPPHFEVLVAGHFL